MKVISLNTWGARTGIHSLTDFLRVHHDTDVFCFQEIWQKSEAMRTPYGMFFGAYNTEGEPFDDIVFDLFDQLKTHLNDFHGFFRPAVFDFFGNAIFVRKNITIVHEQEIFVHKHKEYIDENNIQNHARNIQSVTLKLPKAHLTIVNIHGIAGGEKKDTPERLVQSLNVLQFLSTLDHPYLLCGDFNLAPETQSIAMFENAGMANLIKQYGITSTRSQFYKKPQRYADYAFASPTLHVTSFSVLPDEISDHLALQIVCHPEP